MKKLLFLILIIFAVGILFSFFVQKVQAATVTLRPNAAGDVTGLSQYPTSGSNYDKVDEATPDEDTTYVALTVNSTKKDLYNLPDHTTEAGTINFVKVTTRCKTNEVGWGSVNSYIKTEGTAYSSTISFPGTGYANYSKQWNTNPKVGGAWTWAQIDALQAGFVLYIQTTGLYVRCTQVYVEVDYSAIVVTPPAVTTEIASINLQNNQATLKGNITDTGGENPSQRVLDWGTSSGDYTNSYDCGGGGTGEFSYAISLTPGQIIYYRAKAYNSGGWGYGAEKRVVIYTASGGSRSFKTLEACECSSNVAGGCCDGCHYCPAGTVFNGTSCVDATPTIKCAATVNKCTDGSCSGEKRYPECQSGGVCDSSATTYYTSETVYASTGYTLTSTCGTTGTTLCGYSSWNGCNGTCQKKRDQLRCDAAHNCAYDVGDDFAYLSTAGKVCSGGSEVAPSSSINCDKTINCVDNACSAERFYRGCVAGGTSCTETGKVSYTAWNAPSNYTISETIYKVGDTCTTNQDICGYSDFNKCGGVGSPYSCQKGRDPYRCNGAGSCTYDAGDDWANVAADKVCLNGSEVALSCTYYCGLGGNYCTEDRYKGEFRMACGGTGSCNGITLGCNNIQDCGATSNTCSSKCQKDYTYTCSAGSCGTYHTYTTASQGYRCEGGNLINTGSCALSAYNGRSADKCDKKRDLYRCNGLGSTDANCIFDVGDEWTYVSAYKVANASGQEVDASSADNTGTCHSCTEGSCSGTLKWSECDGSGNPGPCASYNQPETVYASVGYTLTSACGQSGTTYCVTNLCRDGGGWHHRCSKRCDAAHNCEYWIDASCVEDHCTNGIKDCDETGTDCGGSCPSCDTTPPTTGIKIIRTATGEDVTTAGTWLRADNYTIKFEDKDQADGSGLNCENCTCEYSVYACDPGGVNCTTPVTSLTNRSPNWSFQITAGKTDPNYWREGVGRYRIYSGAKDMANNPSATEYRYINFDFTPPWTEIR